MRTVRFKRKRLSNKYKVLITIILSIAFCTLESVLLAKNISERIIIAAEKIVEKDTILLFKNAYSNKNSANIDTNSLINIVKNSNDEIIEVDFNMEDAEKVMLSILNEMSKSVSDYNDNGYLMYVPLGYLSNSPLFINLGPKIPINITTSDIATGCIKTKITDFGINNALVEIYVNIDIEITTLMALDKSSKNLNYEWAIASKIITGSVPSFYNQKITKESDLINLPIGE